MRSYPAGSHLLYYQDADDDLVVVRILHSRQDPSGEDWSLNQGPAEGANEPM
jgi:plasmid stabilization system protein ParE